MSVCVCSHGESFHHPERGCKGWEDYVPCRCRHFDPQEWAERYETDETGMLLDAHASDELLNALRVRRTDESLLKLPYNAKVKDIHLPD
jgi:hypothetical protein